MSAFKNKSISKKNIHKVSGRWEKEEHQKFIEALIKYGKNWKKIEEFVNTRSSAQIRSHAQKFFKKMEKEYSNKENFQKNVKNLRKFSDGELLKPYKNVFEFEEEITKSENHNVDEKCDFKLEEFKNFSNDIKNDESEKKVEENMTQIIESIEKYIKTKENNNFNVKSPQSFFTFVLEKLENYMINNTHIAQIFKPKLSDFINMPKSTNSCISKNETKKTSFYLHNSQENSLKSINYKRKIELEFSTMKKIKI